MYIQLFPDENTPIEPPGIGERIGRLRQEKQSLIKQIESARGAERGNPGEQLNTLRGLIAGLEAVRYTASLEAIDRYRRDMQTAFVLNRDLGCLTDGKEFRQIVGRFRQGQLSLDSFPRESGSMLRLMRLMRLEDD